MNQNLMIIDDAKDQLYLMQMLVKTLAPEIAITAFVNADEALTNLRKAGVSPPRVILMDLKLPGKNGLDLLKEIKLDPKLKKIPVCLFSNGALQEDVCQAYEHGASFYFKKPIGLSELKNFTAHFIELWFHYASICER
ncbi:MAG: response regulator [Deltaproteobacteria bacterium]